MPSSILVVMHQSATWFMTGLIWIVQLVHYPMFAMIDRGKFASSHAFHSRRIGSIVAPAMTAELILAAWLLVHRGRDVPSIAGFALVLLLWALTGLVMVPLHNRLSAQQDIDRNIRALVRWNWLRTAAWSARAAICLFLLR